MSASPKVIGVSSLVNRTEC